MKRLHTSMKRLPSFFDTVLKPCNFAINTYAYNIILYEESRY